MRSARKILIAILLTLIGAPAAFAEGARIRIDNPDFNFGEVLQGETLEHVFTFTNTGNENLVISQVRSSCGCTAALLSADVIAPGKKGEVRASFTSGNFRGKVEKSIYLTSNDPQQGSAVLHLRGVVIPVLAAPNDVDLGVFKPGERREIRVKLTNRSKDAVTLTSVQATLPAVRVLNAPAALAAGKSGEIVLRAVFATREPVSGYLLIRTSHPRVPELRLPFFATVATR